jgi:hypothetical protein
MPDPTRDDNRLLYRLQDAIDTLDAERRVFESRRTTELKQFFEAAQKYRRELMATPVDPLVPWDLTDADKAWLTKRMIACD